MSSAGGDASSAAVTEEIVGADVAFRPKSNVVTLVVLVGTWWTWHFARKRDDGARLRDDRRGDALRERL